MELMTVDMPQTQIGKLAEELYMNGIWDGICNCMKAHLKDALTKIGCKKMSLIGLRKIRDDIWNDLLTHTAPENRVSGLAAADLYPRLVPIKLLPFILDKNNNDSRWALIRNAIGAVAVLWSLDAGTEAHTVSDVHPCRNFHGSGFDERARDDGTRKLVSKGEAGVAYSRAGSGNDDSTDPT
jgi:hypothetical protein